MQKITPFLWFDGTAEQAMQFYVSVFRNAKAGPVHRGPDGKAISVSFELEGQPFQALNGGPQFHFTPAVSFFVNCETQEELDQLYTRLAAGGTEEPCGWLRDRFGLSWQIIPAVLGRLLHDPDPVRAGRVMQAMLKMKKIDIRALEQAAAGA